MVGKKQKKKKKEVYENENVEGGVWSESEDGDWTEIGGLDLISVKMENQIKLWFNFVYESNVATLQGNQVLVFCR